MTNNEYEFALYAYPKYKFRIFMVTYDSDIDVIHDLKNESRDKWLKPDNNGFPIINKCFISLDEISHTELHQFNLYLNKNDEIVTCCSKIEPCDICKELDKN